MNGRHSSAPVNIRSDIFPGDLYFGTVVWNRILTESVGYKSPFNISYIDLSFKNGRMRTLQERNKVPEKRACEGQVPAEAQETQERTLDKHPVKQAKHEVQEVNWTVFTAI